MGLLSCHLISRVRNRISLSCFYALNVKCGVYLWQTMKGGGGIGQCRWEKRGCLGVTIMAEGVIAVDDYLFCLGNKD